MATSLKPVVLDISHHNDVVSFSDVAAAGVIGIIHKASQGAGMSDAKYASRRAQAVAAGLLWGAYHFAENSSPSAQADQFLKCAAPDASTLLALDWEDYGSKTMSVANAREFLTILMQRTGRTPKQIKIYGGNTLKERIKSADDMAFFGQFDLWLCQYGPRAVTPKAWPRYWLWQYSETGRVPGMGRDGKVDLNVFGGADLAAEWACPAPAPVAVSFVGRVIEKREAKKAVVKEAAPRLHFWDGFLDYVGLGGLTLGGLLQQLGAFVVDTRTLAILAAGGSLWVGVKLLKYRAGFKPITAADGDNSNA